jgi:uncharacterized protein HemX
VGQLGWWALVLLAFVFGAGLGYEMGKQRAEADERERKWREQEAEREQRERELECRRKDAGLPPLFPEARKVVDMNDAWIEADERRLKEANERIRAIIDAEDEGREK